MPDDPPKQKPEEPKVAPLSSGEREDPPPRTVEEAIVRRLWKSRLQTALLTLALLAVLTFAVWLSIPDAIKVDWLRALWPRNPHSASDSRAGVEILTDSTFVDLSNWHDRATELRDEQAVRSRVIRFRKIREDATNLGFRAATSGDDIAVRRSTDGAEVRPESTVVIAGQLMNKALSVSFPLKTLRIFEEKTVSFEIVYTNAFQGRTGQWVGFWIRDPTRQFAITVRVPSNKPIRDVRLAEVPPLRDIYLERYTGPRNLSFNEDSTAVTWLLDRPDLGYAYRMDWQW